MNKFINVNKPYGVTSNDVVQYFKWKLKLNKVGHAGTLDPNATGVLVLACDDYTKKISTLVNDNKKYLAQIIFGKQSDTYDSSGKFINESKNIPTIQEIKKTIDKLVNNYEQYPPIYSAIKVKGKKLYDYARSNQEIKLEPRNVKIYDYNIISYNEGILKILINVSKGFYVRSFANDIGILNNTFAYLKTLERIQSGEFKIEDSIEMTDTYKFKNEYVNLRNLNEKIDINNLVIGHFDLLHKGHIELFKDLKDFSILTFVSNPNKKNNFYSNDERLKQLKKLNPNHILYIDLNENMDKDEFIKLLKENLNINKIIIGEDFKFGKDRKGNIEDLKNNFQVEVVKKNEISSTIIKELISKGEINKANNLLINNIYFDSIVCHGKKIGRLLGYPTVNIYFKTNVNLKQGSYSSNALYKNKEYKSASFIRKEYDNWYIIETYIIDFNYNIYGKNIKIILDKFIREIEKPKDINHLKLMIENDLKNIK